MSKPEKEKFLDALQFQVSNDSHDMAIQEKLDIISTCLDKNMNSIITAIPNLEELYSFKKCVRKFCRVKMRAVTYYHTELHSKDDVPEDYLLSNLKFYA